MATLIPPPPAPHGRITSGAGASRGPRPPFLLQIDGEELSSVRGGGPHRHDLSRRNRILDEPSNPGCSPSAARATWPVAFPHRPVSKPRPGPGLETGPGRAFPDARPPASDDYPHTFSGGKCGSAGPMIAIGRWSASRVRIADGAHHSPWTWTVQAQIPRDVAVAGMDETKKPDMGDACSFYSRPRRFVCRQFLRPGGPFM